MREHRIITADRHRNGSGGEGFYVALVETTDTDDPHGSGVYLCVDFCGDQDEDPGNFDRGRFAVLRTDDIAAGNIGMHQLRHPDTGSRIHGTGGAAWRGADKWGDALRQPIREWVRASHEARMSAHS